MSARSQPTPAALGYRMPAEWEPHAATWLAWPHNETDWTGRFAPIPWVFAELARQLTQVEDVRLIVRSAAMERDARVKLTRVGADVARVRFLRLATNRSWTRDFLPLFGVRRRAGRRELCAVKWRFNGWARYPDFRRDDAAGRAVAQQLDVPTFLPQTRAGRARRPVVLEGGAIDVDGQGTLLATEQCLLSGEHARNAPLGRAGVERALCDHLGVTRVIWLRDGIAGDDTTGHVDDFARFVAPGVVVVARESRRSDENHRPLERARAQLEGERDARGRKLRVVTLPMPAPVVFDGQRLPASYANFYVANERVLVPTFDDPNDRVALGVLAELFPKRQVIGVHCRDLVLGLGTLHCSTQQEPRVP